MFLMNWVSIETQTSLRQYQIKPKWLEAVLKVARCTLEVQRRLEQLHERWKNDIHQYVVENVDSSIQLTPELSVTPQNFFELRLEPSFVVISQEKEKVVGGTHKGRCYGLGSRNDVRRLQSGLESIGSSRQAEALDGVQIAAMSDQIAKLIATLAESEWRRVAEQESISETVQQIKEQVMNLARRPTISAPDDTDCFTRKKQK
ncbi:hypothetical protein MTR67_038538 [Solanum verrucosum]|uniref:Uncharacterized protein n=1 Tax=Solanum verrucosum TaxID=315347 RepID=A0AAF0ZPK2_SOLVR|nr:hypothetical protein MTR67_038538 [Solanum verrucosum]